MFEMKQSAPHSSIRYSLFSEPNHTCPTLLLPQHLILLQKPWILASRFLWMAFYPLLSQHPPIEIESEVLKMTNGTDGRLRRVHG